MTIKLQLLLSLSFAVPSVCVSSFVYRAWLFFLLLFLSLPHIHIAAVFISPLSRDFARADENIFVVSQIRSGDDVPMTQNDLLTTAT